MDFGQTFASMLTGLFILFVILLAALSIHEKRQEKKREAKLLKGKSAGLFKAA